MNEPLKGKQYAETMGEPSHMVYFHIDEDIKSAVEWLKEEVRKMKISVLLPKIDEAFEDITSNSAKGKGDEK